MSPFRAIVLACTLLIAACSGGEPDSVDETTANPLLYEIASADGEVEGWLLGTIHALPDGVSWRTAAINDAIEAADVLWVEIADQTDDAGRAATFARLATTPGLAPLHTRVAPELREPLERILARSDIPPKHFQSTEDWAAAIMLAGVDSRGKPAHGVDRAVIRDFEGRPVRGFETTASQLGIFDTLPAEDQQDLLEGTVREWMASRDNPDWLLQAWLAGDEATLARATGEGILADPELHEALLAGRNRRWIALLLPELGKQPKPLVAVGTAHLFGPDGLVAMLEAEGYTLTRR
ncbi:MAG: TraB/GumN family protein [Erythrobacter sp.]|uniref:TraB/GumN family protein n=1 Tax=Erythrobacter sp. TaxID=1042 RepID=UPI003A88012B